MAISVEAVVRNKYGFHIRPSTQFMDLSRKFASSVTVEAGDISADGKSILELMTLGAAWNSVVRITADGPDEAEAVQALKALIDDRFGGIE